MNRKLTLKEDCVGPLLCKQTVDYNSCSLTLTHQLKTIYFEPEISCFIFLDIPRIVKFIDNTPEMMKDRIKE